LKGNIKALPVISSFSLTLRDERQREHGRPEAVNERDPSKCESIQRLNGKGGGDCVKGNEMINGLLRLLVNRREEAACDLVYYYFFSFLNLTSSVRVGRFRHIKIRNWIEPDIFLNILTSSIGFFTGSVFSINFFFSFLN